MRRLRCAVLIVLLTLSGAGADARSGTAAPAVRDGDLLPAPMVKPLLHWVAAEMGVEPDGLFAPAVLLSGTTLRALDRDFLLSSEGQTVRAAYIPGAVILDHAVWTWSEPLEISFLVHELVHHVQQLARPGMTCIDREREAYGLQNRWLAGIGHAPVPVPPADRLGCPGDDPAQQGGS